jgi:hypothetical protein
MTDKHTPGPWSYRSQPHDDWGVVRAGRFIICQARDPDVYESADLDAHRRAKTDPWEANARLIAAAPDLLSACAAAKQFLIKDLEEPGRTVFWNLVDAIAKATGKQP